MNSSSVLSVSNISTSAKGMPLASKAFVFAPLHYSTRLKLFVLLVSVGIIGIVGNVLLLCYLKSRKRKIRITRISAFEKNFLLYIKSLAISDVLCDVIALPPICCQLYLDVFNRSWSCRIVRYLNILFPAVTMNNLLFISIERYFSTRQTPRSLRHSTVKRVIIFAWLAGFFVVLFPAATYRGIRFDINVTHYTVVCKYDNLYFPFRVMFVSYIIIQYIMPGCVIIRINFSLIKTLWTRLRTRKVDIQGSNASTIIRRSAIIRGTFIIVTLTFAFVLPYFFYFAHVIYNMSTQITLDFESDFVIRAAGALLAYSNSVINVIIYMVQMKGFRTFLKKTFTPWFVGQSKSQQGLEIQEFKCQEQSGPRKMNMHLEIEHRLYVQAPGCLKRP